MVTVVGMGPGADEYITPAARQAIESADVVFGHGRWAETVERFGRNLIKSASLHEMVSEIKERAKRERVVALVSGDPGLFSLLPAFADQDEIECSVIPGISSPQVLFARLGIGWSGVTMLSLHGRSEELLKEHIRVGARLCVLTDGKNNAAKIGAILVSGGATGRAVVGENLTGTSEKIVDLRIERLPEYKGDAMALVYLEIADD